jgi:integrase
MTSYFIDVQLQHPDGRVQRVRKASPVNTRRGAERFEHEVRSALLTGTYAKELKQAECPGFGKFADEFMQNYATVNNKPSSQESTASILKHHLIPFFGEVSLKGIGPQQVERYKATKVRTHASKTINNQLTVLHKMLAVALEWGYIDGVPRMKWMKAPKPDFRFLDFHEAERLVKAARAEPMWCTMILLGLRTGLRQGELLALRWCDVDLTAARLVVRQAVARGIVGTPKNHRQRQIPLTASMVEALTAWRHRRSELVFCQDDGSMLTKNQCKWPLRRARKKAGIEALGWHDLRHTFASHLAMRGVPLKVIQELLGHATIEMTMRYAHLTPQTLIDAVGVLDQGYGTSTAQEMSENGKRAAGVPLLPV